jgi:uncharacterized protein YerC
LDEREIYFIDYYKSLTTQNGYNVSEGGGGFNRPKLSFEEQVKCSKLFTIEQVKDIQQMLYEGYEYYEIRSKYPKLSDSFLSNINTGLNFVREDLSYPIATLHTKFSKKTKENIIDEIKNNIPYKEISKKYGISVGYISMINSGQKWHQDNEIYPLCKKGCSDGAWSHDLKKDLIFSDSTHAELGKKYGKAKSTVTAINAGRNRKDSRFLYPLRDNKIKNQEIWNTLF